MGVPAVLLCFFVALRRSGVFPVLVSFTCNSSHCISAGQVLVVCASGVVMVLRS